MEWNFYKTILQVYYICSKHGSQPDPDALQISETLKAFVHLFWDFGEGFLVQEETFKSGN